MDKTELTTVERAEWPEWLAQLASCNSTFEGMEVSVPSVPVDWEQVRHRLAIRRLTRLIELQEANRARHPSLSSIFDQTIEALTVVLRCHESSLLNSAAVDWLPAQSAAQSAAAELAEWSTEGPVEWSARSAAESAWWSAQESVQSEVWSAWWAARSAAEAFDTAESAFVTSEPESAAAWWAAWQTERDDLLAILRNLNTTN